MTSSPTRDFCSDHIANASEQSYLHIVLSLSLRPENSS